MADQTTPPAPDAARTDSLAAAERALLLNIETHTDWSSTAVVTALGAVVRRNASRRTEGARSAGSPPSFRELICRYWRWPGLSHCGRIRQWPALISLHLHQALLGGAGHPVIFDRDPKHGGVHVRVADEPCCGAGFVRTLSPILWIVIDVLHGLTAFPPLL